MGPARRLALLAALALAACSRAVVPAPPPPAVIGAEETGRASWYGHPYHGRPTSSGEIYDMAELTAAHRTLPLGTRLAVTNLDTGRVVEVRVNDRGPFVDGRILDLSWGAARLLDGVGPGVIPVRLRVIGLPGSDPAPPPPAPGAGSPAKPVGSPGAFAVQLGAFASRDRAEALRRGIPGEPTAAVVEARAGDGTFYRVRVGPYPTRGAAQAGAERLAALGYRVVVVPTLP